MLLQNPVPGILSLVNSGAVVPLFCISMATILTSPVSPCLGSKLNRLAPPASHTTLNLSYSASSFPAFRSNTTVFHVSPPLHRDLARCFALPGNKEDKLTQEGLITESLPNGMFRVRLDFTQDVILGYASGRIRRGSIRILPGDRVRIEVSRYDSMKGRIIYRLRGASKDSNPP